MLACFFNYIELQIKLDIGSNLPTSVKMHWLWVLDLTYLLILDLILSKHHTICFSLIIVGKELCSCHLVGVLMLNKVEEVQIVSCGGLHVSHLSISVQVCTPEQLTRTSFQLIDCNSFVTLVTDLDNPRLEQGTFQGVDAHQETEHINHDRYRVDNKLLISHEERRCPLSFLPYPIMVLDPLVCKVGCMAVPTLKCVPCFRRNRTVR
jgi:hypothetical protein